MDTWGIPGYSRIILIWHVFLVGSLKGIQVNRWPQLSLLVFVEFILRGLYAGVSKTWRSMIAWCFMIPCLRHFIGYHWTICTCGSYDGEEVMVDAILSEMMDIEARGLVALPLFEGEFLEAGSEIDHDLLTSFGMPIQPRQDCISRSRSFIQKEVLNAPDQFSRCSAKIQAMAERGRAPVGGGGGANISQHTAMSNLTWPLTLSTLMIWMIELSTNWWIKMILWPTTKRLYNSI